MYRAMLLIIFMIVLTYVNQAQGLGLTIVYDNHICNEELETRWGFSCLVEGLEKTVLFDVGGEGPVLLNNMKKLHIDPGKIEVVVLSHVHYDHIGGLPDFLKKNPHVAVYLPKSFHHDIKERVANAGATMVEVTQPSRICENVYVTGELGYEIKEMSLVIKSRKGLILVTGCAHPGIVNIVKNAKNVFKTYVYLVAGGFHLSGMGERQLKGVIKEIKNEGVKKVAPCHCSGDLARTLFKQVYGEDFIRAGAGKKIPIQNGF